MINCESCNDWFHGTCVHLEESDEQLIDTYICPLCAAKGTGETSWLRKCRLDGCKKPAIQAIKMKGKSTKGSKYCSDAHGVQFFKTKMGNLDVDGLTRYQLKTLLEAVANADEFKSLGDQEPTVPEDMLIKFKTAEDDSRLADLRLEREKIQRKLEIVGLRQTFLQLCVERVKQVNLDLKNSVPAQPTTGRNKSKPKAKEICGFDDRLLIGDPEFLEWTTSEEGKRVFARGELDGDGGCEIEKRRCRHSGWQGLRAEEIMMEESLLRGQLDGITQQEKVIMYVPVSWR
jgi:COMPASS component SPP1